MSIDVLSFFGVVKASGQSERGGSFEGSCSGNDTI
jgi:hypothetical protein